MIDRDGEFLRNGVDSVREEWVPLEYRANLAEADWEGLVRTSADRLYQARLDPLLAAWNTDWDEPVPVGDGEVDLLTYPAPGGYTELVLNTLFAALCQESRPAHPYLPLALPADFGPPVVFGSMRTLGNFGCAYAERVYPFHRAFLAVHGRARSLWLTGRGDTGAPAADVAGRVSAREALHSADFAEEYRAEAKKPIRDLLPASLDEARQYAREAIERTCAAVAMDILGVDTVAGLAVSRPDEALEAKIAALGPVAAEARAAVDSAATATEAYEAMDAGIDAVRANVTPEAPS